MQGVVPHGIFADEILVDSVIIRDSAEECGQVSGKKVYIDIEMSCKSGATYEDCEARIVLSGDVNYDSGEFNLSEGNRITKTINFTMPTNDVVFDITVSECDTFTGDDIAYSQNHRVENVTQAERDSCTPIVPPIDLTDVDTTFVLIGATVGGVAGLITEGKEGLMTYGLLGGVAALAYSYLTSTQ